MARTKYPTNNLFRIPRTTSFENLASFSFPRHYFQIALIVSSCEYPIGQLGLFVFAR